MILIPEIETIVILVPRTGSGSLKRAILKTYSKAHVLYRHMEADGVPHGYDRWRRVGVARNPLDRLWSLYKFCKATVCEPTIPHSRNVRSVRSPCRSASGCCSTTLSSPIPTTRKGA